MGIVLKTHGRKGYTGVQVRNFPGNQIGVEMTQPDIAAIRARQVVSLTSERACIAWINQAHTDIDALLTAIDELEARNAKLEAVAKDDVRDMANFCIAQGASKPWQEIARRLLAALDALDD